MATDIWGDDDEATLTEALVKKNEARYNEPIPKHDCTKSCKMVAGVHEIEDIFDDFELSQRKREIQDMEIRHARGREHKEKMLIRRFQSTADGSYVLRMETVSQLTKERIGDLRFDSQEELDEYYNYCVDVFGFSKALKLGSEQFDESLFDDLFDGGLDDLFDVEDDTDDLFDVDEDDEYGDLFD